MLKQLIFYIDSYIVLTPFIIVFEKKITSEACKIQVLCLLRFNLDNDQGDIV